MGQKVNPIGFRILNNKVWQSVWFDKKQYSNDILYLGFSRIDGNPMFITKNLYYPVVTLTHLWIKKLTLLNGTGVKKKLLLMLNGYGTEFYWPI